MLYNFPLSVFIPICLFKISYYHFEHNLKEKLRVVRSDDGIYAHLYNF